MSKPRQRNDFNVYQGASLGLTLAASTLLFGFLGNWLDEWLATSPWLLIVGCALGVTGGMAHVIRKVNALQSSDGADKADDEAR
ncbi:MAG: AtpZ/AtpI family protein [Planctomycetota bacterium]